MFGYVTASMGELSKEQKQRYNAVYCGICRQIRLRSSSLSRLGLSYDMAFLALLHMSLYEPEETSGKRACGMHPLRPRPWVDNAYIAYSADMNVALAHYSFLDDYADDGSRSAKYMADQLGKNMEAIEARWPRQCESIRSSLAELSRLEQKNCANPDDPAQCFGQLMGELLVYQEDLWAEHLRAMGQALGRFIYLTDAAVDYRKDARKGRYNPFLAQGKGEDPALWEQYLVLAMARCTDHFERLPLVQDKALLDNILYSGVWARFRRISKPQEEHK